MFDEKKFNIKNDYNKNLKKNNNRFNKKNNQKKVYNGILKEPSYNIPNNSSQNKKIISPPLRNKNDYEKNNKIKNIQLKNQNDSNILYNDKKKKNKDENKNYNHYKHNESFEDISINNDILLQYKIESPLIPGQTGNYGNEIIEILNLNGNNNNNNINNKIKKIKKKPLNKSYISQTKYKNIIDGNKTEYININYNTNTNNKINEYITEYKNTTNRYNIFKKKINNKNIYLPNCDIGKKEFVNHFNANDDNEDKLFYNNNNIDELYNDEYMLNSSFENYKNDFFLLYNNNYHNNIKNDMILYEIQLLYEKILELQKSYHFEFQKLYSNYDKEKKIIKLIQNNKILLKKKIVNLFKYKEKNNLKEKNKLYKQFNSKINVVKDSNKINKNELILWNKMIPIKKNIEDNNIKKKILKQIFKNIVFDRYKYLNKKLNDIEKNIVNRLLKKYKYNKKYSENKKGLNDKNGQNSIFSKMNNHINKGNNKKIKKINGINNNKYYDVNNYYKYSFRNKI